MDQPWVTVICLCYNQKDFVLEALESVLQQTHKAVQLIVVDDASSDGSKEVIRNFVEDKPFIYFIDLQRNIGNCKAFNLALQKATGEYFIDLAADDVLLPNRIELGVHIFVKSDLSVGVHFSDAEMIDARGKHLSYHSANFPHVTILQGNIYKELIERYFICSPSMMYRKAVIEVLNGYDENLSYEDFDFWMRSSRLFQYTYSPEVLVQKRILSNSLSQKQFVVRSHLQQSTFLVCEKIMNLNRSTEEQRALGKRLLYEIRTNLTQLNFRLVYRYFILWLKNKTLNYS